MPKTKTDIYRSGCMKYGVLTLCWLLREYTETEYYEECLAIINAIKELNVKFGMDMPTVYNAATERWFQRELQSMVLHDTNGVQALNNIPKYAELLKAEINSEKW